MLRKILSKENKSGIIIIITTATTGSNLHDDGRNVTVTETTYGYTGFRG